MRIIELDIRKILDFIPKKQIFAYSKPAEYANLKLENRTGEGNAFLGWLNLPTSTPELLLDDIQKTADDLRACCDVVVVIGIGGSYLGAKAVIEAVSGSFDSLNNKKPLIVYAGQNIGEDYLFELSEFLKGKSFGIIVISKSGTTTEPAIAFRLLKKQLENEVNNAEEIKKRIVAITDKERGALRELASKEGYKTFVIPDDVGGRYSVLTPVGLLPVAVAGYDIRQLVSGAAEMEKATGKNIPFAKNPAAIYAVVRNELYKLGKKTEILANFNPKLHYVGEWWKQLYGESEGKDHKGIFTASVDFTTDLHSMGQWIQDGERNIFETVLSVTQPHHSVKIPKDKEDLDGLNYLTGKRIDYINKMAEAGTQKAHVSGGVPNIRIRIPILNEFYLGQLLYFFQRACGISGYLLGVNPFDQPGVEAYKKNMFALLGK